MRYCVLIFVKGFQIYETLKFAIIKKLRHFLSEDTFLVSLCSESLLFGQPEFESRQGRTFGPHSSAAHGPKWVLSTSFGRSKTYLFGDRSPPTGTVKACHRMTIIPKWLTQSVLVLNNFMCLFLSQLYQYSRNTFDSESNQIKYSLNIHKAFIIYSTLVSSEARYK